MNTRSAATLAAIMALALAVGGCGSADIADQGAAGPATSSTATAANPGKPVGVIAIGHSGLTGEGSDPNRPGQDALENSWATGTSPQVNSIYRRLVAVRPETDGHVANTAEGGASASTLVAQAQRALETVPTPALVVVQTIDNDIRCDGTDGTHVPEFGVALGDALQVVTTASPDSRILVVGQLGRPSPSFVKKLVAEDPTVKAELTGTGMCDFLRARWGAEQEGFRHGDLHHRGLRDRAGPGVRHGAELPHRRRSSRRVRRSPRELLQRLEPPERARTGRNRRDHLARRHSTIGVDMTMFADANATLDRTRLQRHEDQKVTINTRSIGRWAAAAATIALAAACSAAPGIDKSGSDTVVLRLATIDRVNNNGQSYGPEAFVENLAKVSGGRLKVEMTTEYGGGAADAESNLVKAIASGEVDGGWPSTRAFANAGIIGLEAVEAPMTLTSYAAEKALVSGPVADKLLAKLDGTGVVGLELAVGPLRRPFAAKAPLLGPRDWAGATFRIYNSPVQTEAMHALGATPVNLGFAGWVDEVRTGNLRGLELDIAQYAEGGNTTEAGNVTANVVLWPKVFALAMSQKRFDALTNKQQDWVREAADTAMHVSVDATYDESTIAQDLCRKGTRFIAASPDQITALRTSLQPVLDSLAADPANRALLREIQAIGANHPGGPTSPPSQRTASTAKQIRNPRAPCPTT